MCLIKMVMGLLLGFVEPSFFLFGLMTRPDSNNIAWFLMGDLLRLSLWSGGNP